MHKRILSFLLLAFLIVNFLSFMAPQNLIEQEKEWLAKNWQLWAKWGSSCDIGFDATMFLEKHPQYEWQEGYLKDLPAEPWTIFPLEEKK